MIAVEVGDQQEVDALDPRLTGRRQDPIGVAAVASVAGVDQQRFASRRHDERGLAALDVDEEDFETLAEAGAASNTTRTTITKRAS